MGSPVYRIQAGKGVFDQLKPQLEAQGAPPEQVSLWGQHISLVDAPVHLSVLSGEGKESLLAYCSFAEEPAQFGKSLRPIGQLDSAPGPFIASEAMEPQVTLLDGLSELLRMYRFLHIPKLPKTFTQDILSPYFARKQQPRKQELSAGGFYKVTLYQDSLPGKWNKWLGKGS